jgi:hypothetical protein
MSRDESTHDETTSLARLLRVSDENASPWDTRELGDILAHQLAAPLVSDLEKIEIGPIAWPTGGGQQYAPPIRTYRDLLFHPNPPVELLELVKGFAKRCRSQPDSPLPDEIATLLYYLAITVARLRCGRRISGLDDQALHVGLQWTLSQPWLDQATRNLLEQSLRVLQY